MSILDFIQRTRMGKGTTPPPPLQGYSWNGHYQQGVYDYGPSGDIFPYGRRGFAAPQPLQPPTQNVRIPLPRGVYDPQAPFQGARPSERVNLQPALPIYTAQDNRRISL